MNPPCQRCGARTQKRGYDRRGQQRWRCLAGSHPEPPQFSSKTPRRCPYCDGRTTKDGIKNGKQGYFCTRCGRKCRGPLEAKPKPPTARVIRQRRQQAALLDAALLTMIRAALPDNLPPDLRDDIAQEMATDALDGAFDLSELARHVPTYRTRINRLSSHTARFISIDAVVPGTSNLTFAETLIG